MVPPPLSGLPEANTYHFPPGPSVTSAGSCTSRSPLSWVTVRAVGGAAMAAGAAATAARLSRAAVTVNSDARRTGVLLLCRNRKAGE